MIPEKPTTADYADETGGTNRRIVMIAQREGIVLHHAARDRRDATANARRGRA